MNIPGFKDRFKHIKILTDSQKRSEALAPTDYF